MSFKAYWPRYLAAHRHPGVRKVHVVATGAALVCAAVGLVTRQRWLLLFAPGLAMAPARLSHHFYEDGAEQIVEEPLYDVMADVLLLYKTLDGSIEAELEAVATHASAEREPGDGHTPQPNMVTDRTLH